jgi:hypothetical protein
MRLLARPLILSLPRIIILFGDFAVLRVRDCEAAGLPSGARAPPPSVKRRGVGISVGPARAIACAVRLTCRNRSGGARGPGADTQFVRVAII